MDSERVIQDARSVYHDLSEIFAHEGDFSDDTLDEVARLCEVARLVFDDDPDCDCQCELSKIERYARQLAAGDTSQWKRGEIPGNLYLRGLIIDMLKAADLRLHSHALRKRSANIRSRAMVARQHAAAVHA